MNDTDPETSRIFIEMMQKKTPEERMFMSSSMHATSRALVIAAIRRENPSITPTELKQELFLRFYGDDFSFEEKEKILKYLAENTSSSQNYL